jgi:hypothetical protein
MVEINIVAARRSQACAESGCGLLPSVDAMSVSIGRHSLKVNIAVNPGVR